MDVAVVAERFYPDSMAVAIRMRHLVRALGELPSTRVTLYTGSRGVTAAGFRLVRTLCPPVSNELPYPVRFLAEWLLGLELSVRILLAGRRVWIITSPPFIATWLCCLACVVRGAPFVLDVRDGYPQVYFAAGLARAGSRLGRLLLRAEAFLYRRAALIAVATQGLAAQVRAKADDPEKVVLLTNGFDEELFTAGRDKYEEFTAVFHGNLGRFQRPDLIVRLARRCRDAGLRIRFLVVGWGSNREELREEIPANLEFLGRVDYEQIPGIIGRAHVGMSFRTDDAVSRASFPVKVYEYMGVAVPVLVTPRSEGGEFVEAHGIGFQFSPEDEDGIFARLRHFYEHPAELQALTERCLAIRGQFSRSYLSRAFAARLAERFERR